MNFTPHRGHEPSGKHPALVVSFAAYNRGVGLALCCPITSRVKGYPFEVVLPAELKTQGAILSDHIKNLDWKARKAIFIERVSKQIGYEVAQKIQVLLMGE